MYLLDNNVIKTLSDPNPDINVLRWLDSVDDADIYITVAVIMEQRKGIEAQRKKNADPIVIAASEAKLKRLITDHWDQFIHIDNEIAEEWGRLFGMQQKHFTDMMIAASANIKGYTVVTRNVKDFKDRADKILDPFRWRAPRAGQRS